MESNSIIVVKISLLAVLWIALIPFIPIEGNRSIEFPFIPTPSTFSKASLSYDPGNEHVFVRKPAQPGFTENKGQLRQGKDILFYLEQEGLGMYLRNQGITYVWVEELTSAGSPFTEQKDSFRIAEIHMNLLGSNLAPKIKKGSPIPGTYHYYNEKAPEGYTHIQRFQEIRYEEIYPSIDLVIYFQEGGVKYDFVVKPGGKVEDIQLEYSGQRDIDLQETGSIQIESPLGILTEGKPYTFQEANGKKKEIPSSYSLTDSTVSFCVAPYDSSNILVIDPTLIWATYFGATATEIGEAVCTDDLGNVYIAGKSNYGYHELATNWELEEYWGGRDAFIAKFDPSGALLWATYYGGEHEDAGMGVCTDPDGNVFLTGYTTSEEGIHYYGHDDTYNEGSNSAGNRHGRDAFLVKFTPSGYRVWGTYYGGETYLIGDVARAETGMSIASDSDGFIYMTGATTSESFIAADGFDNSLAGEADAFLVKFDNYGNREWATYFGGDKMDIANSVCLDPSGNVYIAGYTESSGLGHMGHSMAHKFLTDAFLAKFSADGDRLWSTYYGGTSYDEGHSIAIDPTGNFVFLAGVTGSKNFIANSGYDDTHNGGYDAFLVAFNTGGLRLWGTYFGGPDDETCQSCIGEWSAGQMRTTHVSVSKNLDVYLSGTTKSETGIATNGSYDPSFNGNYDGYLVRFLPDGSRQWATYYGGNGADYVLGNTTDVAAKIYIVGHTRSEEGIAWEGHDNEYKEEGDAFLAKFEPYGGGPNDDPGDFEDPKDPNDRPYPGKNSYSGRSGLSLSSPNASFSLYPNPASGRVEINALHGHEDIFQIQLFDSMGNHVYTQENISRSQFQLDLHHLPTGTYFVRFTGSRESYTQKLILK
ncbi:MAG: SBBP repeat-containing protein [Bacteroidota bacterium]